MAGQHLYIIQSHETGHIKVGRSDSPERRLAQLQTGSPNALRIILIAWDKGDNEKRVHRLLQKYKASYVHGSEWFTEDCMGNIPDDIWQHISPHYLERPDWWKPQIAHSE